jgi:DNA polymerase III subunit delta'
MTVLEKTFCPLFEDIYGNDHNKAYLEKLLLKKQLSNTNLFHGPDGIGKSLFAQNLAMHLIYPDGISDIAKQKMLNNNHPDLHIYKPEGKTSMHSIAAMRDLISQVYIAAFEGKAKVFIIHDAERMLPSSANALLKTLEEPTFDSFIFLLTSKLEDMLPTIVSRCSKILFQAIPEETLATYLVEKKNKTPSIAAHLAALSYGSMQKAIELATETDHEDKLRALFKILGKDQIFHYADLMDAIEKLEALYQKESSSEKNEQEEDSDQSLRYHKDVESLFAQILLWYRDLHLLKNGVDRRFLLFSDHLALLQSQNLEEIPSMEKVHLLIEEAKLALDRNIRLRTLLEVFFLKIQGPIS